MVRPLNRKKVNEMCSKMTLGQRLKFARTRRGLTMRDLEKATGVHRNSICKYEREEREPSFFAVTCLADGLKVSLDWLANRGSDRWRDLN